MPKPKIKSRIFHTSRYMAIEFDQQGKMVWTHKTLTLEEMGAQYERLIADMLGYIKQQMPKKKADPAKQVCKQQFVQAYGYRDMARLKSIVIYCMFQCLDHLGDYIGYEEAENGEQVLNEYRVDEIVNGIEKTIQEIAMCDDKIALHDYLVAFDEDYFCKYLYVPPSKKYYADKRKLFSPAVK